MLWNPFSPDQSSNKEVPEGCRGFESRGSVLYCMSGDRPRGHKNILSWEDSPHLHLGMQRFAALLYRLSAVLVPAEGQWGAEQPSAFQVVSFLRSRPLTPAVFCCLVATPGSLSWASLEEVMRLRADLHKLWCTISGMRAASNLYSLWRKLVLLGVCRTWKQLLSPKAAQLGNIWSGA